MKNVKYILNDNDPYDYHRLQEKLTQFAAEGWHLEKISNLMMKFSRGEPKQVRYEITYSAAASAYNSQPTEAEKELADLCAEAGWELAAAYAQLQIYRNEDPNAPPLETDEVQKYQNIRRNIMKHQIPQQFMMIALFAAQFLLHGSDHWTKLLQYVQLSDARPEDLPGVVLLLPKVHSHCKADYFVCHVESAIFS